MTPLIGLAISLVPELLQLFTGDKTGQIAKKVTDVVTAVTRTKSPEEAQRKILEDAKLKADLQIQLAQIAVDAQRAAYEDAKSQRDAELAAGALANESTKGAREMTLGLTGAGSSLALTPAILSYLVVAGFLTLVVFMWIGKPPSANDGVLQTINILIGALAAAFATVMNFWLGSSLGSRNKDNAFELQVAHAQAARNIPTRQPTPVAVDTPSADVGARIRDLARREKPDLRPDADFSDGAGTPDATSVEPAQPARPGLIGEELPALTKPHRHFPDGVEWALTPDGIEIDGVSAKGTMGDPTTVRDTIWQRYGDFCAASARKWGVPVELVVTTIATESRGKADARRPEPQLRDESVGLMQTLVETARDALGRPQLAANDLLDPATSIDAGTAFIAKQRLLTHFDPPLVAAAYNAGSLKKDDSAQNRWKLHCFPKGTGRHIDTFVAFFADSMKVSAADGWGSDKIPSFAAELSGGTAPPRSEPPTSRAVDKSSPSFPPRPDFAAISSAAREQTFGKPRFVASPQPGNPEHIEILDDWEVKNIKKVSIPIKGIVGRPGPIEVRFHKLAADQLIELWLAWEKEGLLDRVLSFDGAYVPRFMRGSTTKLSNHAFGTAFDINASFNSLKARPALVGQRGSVRELVPIANDLGFFWGGFFNNRPDGMHFEVAELHEAQPELPPLAMETASA
jgi:hypothetical protein